MPAVYGFISNYISIAQKFKFVKEKLNFPAEKFLPEIN